MEFKAGDRVHVTRVNTSNVDFFTTLQYVKLPGLYRMIDSTDSNYNGQLLWKSNQRDFGPDKDDYYVLAEDEEDTEEPVIQCTEPLDKGEIIAQSIIDNRDGSSFLSTHEMIMWLNEIEEMHGENISVKGWNLIFDCVKTSIAPVFFGKE